MTQYDIAQAIESPNLNGLGTNLANGNKWLCYLPIEDVLGSLYKNLELHLVRFNIPQLEMQSMEQSYRGYTKTIPTKVIAPSTKEVTIEYLVDAEWQNYKSFYAWMSAIEGTLNPVVENENLTSISPSKYIPLRVYLLSPFKKKLIQFVYSNCWIKVFNDIALDVNNPQEITHSVTLAYDRFTIEQI